MKQAREAQVSHTHPTETQATPASARPRPRETQTTPASPKLPISGPMEQAREAQVSHTPTTTHTGAARVSRTHPWFSSAHAKPRASAGNTTRPPDPIGVGRSVAVALGFEPRVAVTPHSISSAAPSAARTRYLTLPLYYSHPLGTQIGHARWEQSHIRAPPAATVKHPRFPPTSDGLDTPCPPPPSTPAPPSGLPLDAGGRGAPQDGGPGQLAGPLTTKTPHTGARYRRIEDDTGQAHVASAQGHGLTGVTGPAGD